jgi:WD40 repeat protein
MNLLRRICGGGLRCDLVALIEDINGGTFRDFQFSSDSNLLAAADGNEAGLRLWDTNTGGQKAVVGGKGFRDSSVAFSPDGRILLVGHLNGSVSVCNTRTLSVQHTLAAHDLPVNTLAFSPDSALFASGNYEPRKYGDVSDTHVRLWDARTYTLVWELKGHVKGVRRVVFSPDGTLLASSGDDGLVILWDVQTGRMVRQLPKLASAVRSIGFASGILMSAGSSVYFSAAPDGTPMREVPIPRKGLLTSAALSSDGTFLLTTFTSGELLGHHWVEIRDATTGIKKWSHTGQTLAGVNPCAFAPSGRLFAAPFNLRRMGETVISLGMWRIQ